MLKQYAVSKAAVLAAAFVFCLASPGPANANVLVNGWFTAPGPNGPHICITGSASGWSAAANWAQWAVVPGSYICTDLETTFLPRIRVRTNGGAWPAASSGNGIGQSFAPIKCAVATYWYNVVSGQVTGNLVRSDNNAFIDFVTVLKAIPNNPGAWKHFISIWDQGAEGLAFETLAPAGIIAEVNYQLMDADIEACTAAPPIKDLSNYLTCSQAGCPPISFSNDPSDPWVKIQLKNVSSVAVQGPIHLFIEGLTSGRAVANPDGDYLGSPFMDLVSSSLAPGQTEDVTIRFNSDRAGSIPIFRVTPVSGGF